MQKVDDLDEGFLRLILPGDIGKGDAGLLFHIDLRLALAHAAHAAQAAGAHLLAQGAHQKAEEQIDDCKRQQPADNKSDNRRDGLDDLIIISDFFLIQQGHQVVELHIGDQACVFPLLPVLGDGRLVLGEDVDPVGFEDDLGDITVVHHLQKGIVGDFLVAAALQAGRDGVEQQREEHRDNQQRQVALKLGTVVIVVLTAVLVLVPVRPVGPVLILVKPLRRLVRLLVHLDSSCQITAAQMQPLFSIVTIIPHFLPACNEGKITLL